MLNRHAARDDRKKKLLILVIFFLLPFVFCILFYIVAGTLYLPKQRTSILFLTDPVEVASYEPVDKQWTIISFPAETHIAGIAGLGEYAVDSLWNIAATESSPSAVVLGSLTDELGVPIDYYIGEKGKTWEKRMGEEPMTGKFFSISAMIQHIFHTTETNMPITLYISLARAFRTSEPERIHSVTLKEDKGLVSQKLPDSSTILVFDRNQFDGETDDLLEDGSIRQEGLRISVFNTTGRPFLGGRVGRILTKLGGNVVQIGNENTPIDECLLYGTQPHLSSRTAQSIMTLFDCKPMQKDDVGRVDLVVKIGLTYEGRFLPKRK